ncbi:unnamed protein product [Nyctereutes procyonoides]|uniref:(raccoon dog) hypothetical protein n=1 Tax=Nyctereutes procyonoides TaxID=34880 RepID=A0A811ZKM7_NYCPR|nr:unnamed protein product [Nyctereutes procyonoides]
MNFNCYPGCFRHIQKSMIFLRDTECPSNSIFSKEPPGLLSLKLDPRSHSLEALLASIFLVTQVRQCLSEARCDTNESTYSLLLKATQASLGHFDKGQRHTSFSLGKGNESKQSCARDEFWPLASCFFQVVFHPLMYLNGIQRGCPLLPPKELLHTDRIAAPTSHIAYSFSSLLRFLRVPQPSAVALRNQGMCLGILQNGRENGDCYLQDFTLLEANPFLCDCNSFLPLFKDYIRGTGNSLFKDLQRRNSGHVKNQVDSVDLHLYKRKFLNYCQMASTWSPEARLKPNQKRKNTFRTRQLGLF